jgi:drug/metabolite transporter (DMT)-like permease
MRRPAGASWIGPLVADAAAVVLFAAAGRNTHDESSGVTAVLTIAAPFLLGLAGGWIASSRARHEPTALPTGVLLWLTTVAVGLVLRRTIWDRGTRLSFVIVATLVLGALIVGWRAMYVFARRQRGLPSTTPPSKAGR